MQAHHIAIDDLYTFVLPQVKTWQHSDGCHFLPEGSAQILREAIGKGLTVQPIPNMATANMNMVEPWLAVIV